MPQRKSITLLLENWTVHRVKQLRNCSKKTQTTKLLKTKTK